MFWGEQRSTSSASRLCCSSFSVSVLNFATSPNSGQKFFLGVLRSEKSILRFIFSGCASSSWFFICFCCDRATHRVVDGWNGYFCTTGDPFSGRVKGCRTGFAKNQANSKLTEPRPGKEGTTKASAQHVNLSTVPKPLPATQIKSQGPQFSTVLTSSTLCLQARQNKGNCTALVRNVVSKSGSQ